MGDCWQGGTQRGRSLTKPDATRVYVISYCHVTYLLPFGYPKHSGASEADLV
jgi:hypothetical protein